MQSYSIRIGTDPESSYIELNYNHSITTEYNFLQYFIYGSTVGGFSAGDNVRYVLPYFTRKLVYLFTYQTLFIFTTYQNDFK